MKYKIPFAFQAATLLPACLAAHVRLMSTLRCSAAQASRRNLKCYGYNTLLLILLCVISGCGFHLRGVIRLSTALQHLYIVSDNPYGPITLQLKQILAHSGVDVEDTPNLQTITLNVQNERYRTATFSESASSKTKQYTLFLSLDYALQNNKGTTLFGPKTITAQSNYTVNEDAVLTTTTQENNVRASLQRQAVYLLLEQLNSKAVTTALQTVADNDSTLPEPSKSPHEN